MKTYFNQETKEWYYEGTKITRKVEHGIFSGYPTEEHLLAWGFEEYIPPVEEVVEEELDEPVEDEIDEEEEPIIPEEPEVPIEGEEE